MDYANMPLKSNPPPKKKTSKVTTLFGGRSKSKVVKMKYFGFSILAAFLSAKASMLNMDPSGCVKIPENGPLF